MNTTLRWMTARPGLGWLTAVPFLLVPLWWAFDDEAPFEIISVPEITAAPGDTVAVAAQVRRDTTRGCSATFNRYLFDGARFRHDIGGEVHRSAAEINALEEDTPGELLIKFEVPRGASPGPAHLHTSLRYFCNPWHSLRPINVLTTVPFTITG